MECCEKMERSMFICTASQIITAAVLFFYRINKRSYNRIMTELNAKKQFEVIKND